MLGYYITFLALKFSELALVALISIFFVYFFEGELLLRLFYDDLLKLLVVLSFFFILYFFCRILMGLLSSLLLTFFSFSLLYSINRMKQGLTSEPLTWNDISSFSNFSVIDKYISSQQIMLMLIFVVIFLFFLFFEIKKSSVKNNGFLGRFFSFGILLFFIPFSTNPYTGAVKTHEGMRYMSWDWSGNVEFNGLLVHLMQTSMRVLPPVSTKKEKETYAELIGHNVIDKNITSLPNNIVIVMCEACWHGGNYFEEYFEPLNEAGFSSFRSSSPVYGGGTVNASLEFNLGMPVPGVLTGVVYQEYASLISEKAATYARALRDVGYTTFSMHNHVKKFWKREQVLPKLGYDYFYSIEDMIDNVGFGWADDGVMYDKALEVIKNSSTERNYLYLTTVYTHGPYPFNNDYGEQYYTQRLDASVKRFADFQKKLRDFDPNVLILFFSDHKPAMNKFFYEKGVFPRSFFSSVGEVNEDFVFSSGQDLMIKGDVPAYVYYHDIKRVSGFLDDANGKPFYCLSYSFNKYFTSVSVPAFNYISASGECLEKQRSESFPAWLYSMSLLGY